VLLCSLAKNKFNGWDIVFSRKIKQRSLPQLFNITIAFPKNQPTSASLTTQNHDRLSKKSTNDRPLNNTSTSRSPQQKIKHRTPTQTQNITIATPQKSTSYQ
jgi:hypothetical protein